MELQCNQVEKNGVWTKLEESNPSLITNHCKDHRLALACRDSYKHVKVVKRLDNTLDNLNKYYKYSCNHTKSLENVQKALGEPVLKVKKAKHHRWLSHGQAVRAIVTSYRAIIIDIESNTISGDPVGNGLLKNLKDPYILSTLLLLADVLPQMTTLSLFFQRRDIHLDECSIDVTKMNKFNSTVRDPFLTELIDNIETRFVDTDAMDNLALLDTSMLEEVPETYAVSEIMELSSHFAIADDILLNEWISFCELIGDKSSHDRTIMACLKFLSNSNLGLIRLYPNMIHLLSTAAVLPLSTAEVERVFSQVKLVKCDHRNRMKQDTLQNILHVKLNCDKQCFNKLCDKIFGSKLDTSSILGI
ncbi:unnamed protein product [Mytilus coruscus]|uniref:HAT C-terminal dimerisation domain-containing protein n=1 Tax=Mytilus coruscus TaxID=42192 RepID=A0A6J8ALM4_MYTCO|nr:unnamed protein product [Mytilus coruscus]